MSKKTAALEVYAWIWINLILLTILGDLLGINLKAFATRELELIFFMLIASIAQTGFRRLMFQVRATAAF